MRRKRLAAGETITYRMWQFPGLTCAVIPFIIGVLSIRLDNQNGRCQG